MSHGLGAVLAGAGLLAGGDPALARIAPPSAPAGGAREPAAVSVKVVPADSRQEAAVRAALAPVLRQAPAPRTLAEVDQWSQRLTLALRHGGFPLGQVLMTQDDWRAQSKSGQAVFSVYPGRVTRIEVRNASRVSQRRLERLVSEALCGAPVLGAADGRGLICLFQTARFERATQLLQDLPGVAVDGAPQIGPGAGVGEVDVVFKVARRGRPYALSASLDDGGIPTTGRLRATVAASANNYFGRGEDYAISVTATDKHMWTGSFSGGVPILSDGLRLTAGFTRQQYTVTDAGTTFVGTANTGSVGLTYPFTRGLDRNVWGGLSYLHSATAVDYSDFGLATHSTIDAARLSLTANNGDRAQQLRASQWAGQVALTAGVDRTDDPLDAAGPRQAGDYAKLSLAVSGSLVLDKKGELFVSGRLNGQYASRNLDPSEKLGVGGPSAVRAYRSDEPSMDDGLILGVGLYKRLPVTPGNQIQVGPFIDAAYGRVNHSPWAGWAASYPGVPNVRNTRMLAGYGLEAGWLTPFGATLSVSASKPFGFSDGSWIEPDKKPIQYWLTLSWSH